MTSVSSTNMDALTSQAILHRETIVKNYIPIVQVLNNLPMLTLRKDGECEVGDPRACIHHQNSSADLVCSLYVDISRDYFNAMILAGYIAHGLRVVLHCTEYDEYDGRIVVKRSDGKGPADESVEDMIDKFRNKQGGCRPGVDVINLSMGYELHDIKMLKRNRSGDPIAGERYSTVQQGTSWRKKLQLDKKLHDCQRKLLTDEAVRNLSGTATGCRRDTAPDPGRVVVPTLIIHAAWCFPGHEQRRKMVYAYRM